MTARTTSIISSALLALLATVSACEGDSGESSGPFDGKSYHLSVPTENWSRPDGIGDSVGPYVPMFLISFGESSDGEVEVLVGSGAAGGTTQEPCSGTTTVTLPSPATPNEIGPITLPVHLSYMEPNSTETLYVDANVYDLTLTNVLPEGGDDDDDNGELTATLDIREVAEMFTQAVPSPEQRSGDSVCTALASFGASCQPCNYEGGDGMTYCLDLAAIVLSATEDASLEITPNPDASC